MSDERQTIIDNCLSGKSKAQVFSQDIAAELWARGYWTVRSGNGNVRGQMDKLTHYGTLSAIKMITGDIIGNTQDWGAGWAKAPYIPHNLVKADLPLSALESARVDIHRIEIVEVQDYSTVLFKVKDSNAKDIFYLFGRDEFRPFVVELSGPVETVEAALESLKPEIIKEVERNRPESEIIRQGDFFFINLKWDREPDHPETIQHREMRKAGTWTFNEANGKGYSEGERYKWTPTIMDKSGEPSRHHADHLFTGDSLFLGGSNEQVVTGYITHPEHKRIFLKGWWAVIQNTAVRSISVTPRAGGGKD